MKQENEYYEKWLNALRDKQPILKNPEELTEAIMNEINQNTSGKKCRLFLTGAWVSGVAAVFLLCFLLNEIYFAPMNTPLEKENRYGYWQKNTSLSLPENWNEMRNLEKNAYLTSRYAQNRELRQAWISKLINKSIH